MPIFFDLIVMGNAMVKGYCHGKILNSDMYFRSNCYENNFKIFFHFESLLKKKSK